MSSRRKGQHQVIDAKTGLPAGSSDATRQAILEVVQVWLDRLQLISLITTFFASIDGVLIGFTTTANVNAGGRVIQLMFASLTGALVFHICAAITSFTGSFVLIRYKLLDAKKHEHTMEHPTPKLQSPTEQPGFPRSNTITIPPDSDHPQRPRNRSGSIIHNITPHFDFFPGFPSLSSMMTSVQGRVSINRVHLYDYLRPGRNGAVDPEHNTWTEPDAEAELEPPIKLLSRCHSLSVAMSVAGFVLVVLGILAFVWTSLPRSVSIFTSACLGMCIVSALMVFTLA